LVDRTGGGDFAHDVAATAERTDRHSTADDLAQDRQIGSNTEQRLGPAPGETETRHDFIEDQQRAMGVAMSAKRFEKTWLRRNQSHVAHNRLDDDAGDSRAMLFE
jgi:hypothetical protein